MAAFAGSYSFEIPHVDRISFQFPVFGDFAADLVVGSYERRRYCFVEFEDAGEDSVFARSGDKTTREWSRRLEHGFGQLVDWFYLLDDMRNTQRAAQDFGHGHKRFYGLLVIGRSAGLSADEQNRLDWRSDRLLVNSHKIVCLTYDDLYTALRQRIEVYADPSKAP